MSFSKYNVNALTDPLSALPSPIIRRPRRNSVFVGSTTTMAVLNPPPRRVKSAMDIQHLVVNDHSPTSLSGSLIPILNRDRRPSINIERPHFITRHRPSMATDKPLFTTHHHLYRPRRSSCFVGERPTSSRHKNFISFDHPLNAADRKMSITIERPSCSQHQPTFTFETHVKSIEHPFVIVEAPSRRESAPSRRESAPSYSLPKMSKSFEQPPKDRPKPERMANSLDVSSLNFDRRCSIPEEDRSSPVSIYLDETRITAPLLEGLKSSDV